MFPAMGLGVKRTRSATCSAARSPYACLCRQVLQDDSSEHQTVKPEAMLVEVSRG